MRARHPEARTIGWPPIHISHRKPSVHSHKRSAPDPSLAILPSNRDRSGAACGDTEDAARSGTGSHRGVAESG